MSSRHFNTIVLVLAAACSCAVFASIPAGKLDEWKGLVRSETLDVFLKDRIVGTLVHSLTIVDSISALCVITSMTVQGSPGMSTVGLVEQRLYNADGALRSAHQSIKGESGTNEWKLDKNATGWVVLITAGGMTSSVPVASVCENIAPTLDLYKSIKTGQCRKGYGFCDTAFELVSQKNVATTYRCAAVTAGTGTVPKHWTFDVVDDLAGRSQTWELDADARTLSQDIEGVFVARVAKKDGTLPKVPVALSELADIFSVKTDRRPQDFKGIAVTFQSGLTPDSSVLGMYQKHAERWVLCGLAQECGTVTASAADTAFSGSAWTKPTVTIQSGYPAIISLARGLKSGRKDRCAIIDTCNRYVYASLAKRNTATFSSAVETLKAGFGDCGEHAVLLAAILRAAGVPARVVLGLLYYAPKKAFVGHAWVMAYAGQWIFCDPAFGVFPAGQDRVPLIIDDNGAHAMLITKYIGRIGIEYELH
jgi:hypothetical protein